MNAAVLAVCLGVVAASACTIGGNGPPPVAAPVQPTEELMPSEVLDRQDPGADTSRNPVLSRSSSGSILDGLLGGLFGGRSSSSMSMGGPAEAPHYYKGCGGCASDGGGAGGAGGLALSLALALSRSRGRRRGALHPGATPRTRTGARPPGTCTSR